MGKTRKIVPYIGLVTLLLLIFIVPSYAVESTPGAAEDALFAKAWAGDREALDSLRSEAEMGEAFAQLDLAKFYDYRQNKKEAAEWYPKAFLGLSREAEKGNAVTQYQLGLLYFYGNGVESDIAKAGVWIKKAAEQGLAEAENKLASFYFSGGNGFPKDWAEMVKWTRKAADQGNGDAQWELGRFYYYGRGVAQSYEDTYFWISLSIKTKPPTWSVVRELCDRAEQNLTPQQIKVLDGRRDEWKPTPAPLPERKK